MARVQHVTMRPLGLKKGNYTAGPRHREGAERPRRSHVKNPALQEEIAALAPLVRNDFFK